MAVLIYYFLLKPSLFLKNNNISLNFYDINMTPDGSLMNNVKVFVYVISMAVLTIPNIVVQYLTSVRLPGHLSAI